MDNKKTKQIFISSIFAVLLSLALLCLCFAGCNEQKATIKLGTLNHATTSLTEGNYEINKEISFTVNAEIEYNISTVKMNEIVLTGTNGTYTFKPTEKISYTLSVETVVNEYKAAFTFESATEPQKKGVKLFMSDDIINHISNNTLNLENGNNLVILGRQGTPSPKDVWIRKIEFIFASGKDNLTYNSETDEGEQYQNGVWSDSRTEGDHGSGEVVFRANGNVKISKIIVSTQDYQAFKTTVSVNNLEQGDKIYYMKGSTIEDYANKLEFTSSTKFNAFDTYFLTVEANMQKAKYFYIYNILNSSLPVGQNALPSFELEVTPGKIIKIFQFVPARVQTQELNITWIGKEALNTIKVNEANAIKYISGFMETEPTRSLGILDSIIFGEEIVINLLPKTGYTNIVLKYNGKDILPEKNLYKITIAPQDENTLDFSAETYVDTRNRIALTGENAQKGVLIYDEVDGQIVFIFEENKNYPTAKMTDVKFNGASVAQQQTADETFYMLNNEQTVVFKNATTDEAKSALFVVTIDSTTAYTSTLIFNSGNFSVEVKNGDNVISQESDGTARHVYKVAGNTNLSVKLTANDTSELYAVEVDDVRITDTLTKNADGTWSFEISALKLNYNIIVQTKTAKVQLTKNITSGYDLEDFPTDAVECGKAITLKITPDDSLFGKTITVTYNGQPITVDTSNYSFTFAPLKTATEIIVTITETQN